VVWRDQHGHQIAFGDAVTLQYWEAAVKFWEFLGYAPDDVSIPLAKAHSVWQQGARGF
jgi:hypothetical protein